MPIGIAMFPVLLMQSFLGNILKLTSYQLGKEWGIGRSSERVAGQIWR